MNFVLAIAVAKVAIGNDLKNMKLMKNVLYFDDFFYKISKLEVEEKFCEIFHFEDFSRKLKNSKVEKNS